MQAYFVFINSVCFFMMLFWRKNVITGIVFWFACLLAILIAIAGQYNDFLLSPSPNGEQIIQSIIDKDSWLANQWELLGFYAMLFAANFFVGGLLIIWLYQWFLIGKEREKNFFIK